MTEAVELELLGIVKVRLGGYVVGRSAEKVAEKTVVCPRITLKPAEGSP